MRAVVCRAYGPLEGLSVEEIKLGPPGPEEVQVRIDAAGVNFPDILVVQGKYQSRPPLPFVPGTELAGVVTSVGREVTHLVPGMEVVGMVGLGAFAGAANVRASRTLPRPASMGAIEAAGFSMAYGTSMHALRQRANLRPGETLLVLGSAGGVGLAAVTLAKAMGANVIAAASSTAKLEVARAAGADHLVNYSSNCLKEAVRSLTNGRGVDVVFDPVGGALLEEAIRVTAWGGRILVVGFASGEIPRVPANLFLLKGSALVGVFFGTFRDLSPETNRQNFDQMFAWYEAGLIRPLISQVMPLEQTVEALGVLSSRSITGKLVLLP